MPPYGILAGSDEGDKTERTSPAIARTSRRPHRELTDGASQEIKSRSAVHLVECVADPGLARLQFQSHLFQPGGNYFLTLSHNFLRCMENNEIIRVADQGGSMELLTFDPAGRKSLLDQFFQSMECDVGQEG